MTCDILYENIYRGYTIVPHMTNNNTKCKNKLIISARALSKLEKKCPICRAKITYRLVYGYDIYE